jgi:hypothetical protein
LVPTPPLRDVLFTVLPTAIGGSHQFVISTGAAKSLRIKSEMTLPKQFIWVGREQLAAKVA